MAEISADSNEQSLSVSQVGEAVTQMDQVTQQNAALVEQMAAAASSLKIQAQELVQTVAAFKLGAADSSNPMSLATAKVRMHPAKPIAFKGSDRRAGGVPKRAAARGHSSAARPAAASLGAAPPLAAPAKAAPAATASNATLMRIGKPFRP